MTVLRVDAEHAVPGAPRATTTAAPPATVSDDEGTAARSRARASGSRALRRGGRRPRPGGRATGPGGGSSPQGRPPPAKTHMAAGRRALASRASEPQAEGRRPGRTAASVIRSPAYAMPGARPASSGRRERPPLACERARPRRRPPRPPSDIDERLERLRRAQRVTRRRRSAATVARPGPASAGRRAGRLPRARCAPRTSERPTSP